MNLTLQLNQFRNRKSYNPEQSNVFQISDHPSFRIEPNPETKVEYLSADLEE